MRYSNSSLWSRGLKGEAIPLFSRIIAIADAFDNEFSNYDMQNKDEKKQVIESVMRDAGNRLDPELLSTFLHAFQNVLMN